MGKPTLICKDNQPRRWLDNAATWDGLAPLLAERGWNVVCPDFLGHGKSDHIPFSLYSMETHLTSVYLISLALGWDSFTLLSHSMGGSIAILFAGAMPGLVQSLIVFESLGMFYTFLVLNLTKVLGQ